MKEGVGIEVTGFQKCGKHNGFVFDKRRRECVVKEQVVGETNLSFKLSPTKGGGGGQPSILRTESNDSVGTGISGLLGVTYNDIALDA